MLCFRSSTLGARSAPAIPVHVHPRGTHVLLALAIFAAYWCYTSRRQGNPWPETLAALAMQAGAVALLGWLFPAWVWKTVLMAYMTIPWWMACIMVWRTHRVPAEALIEPYDPAAHGELPGLRERMRPAMRALQAAGLVPVGTFFARDAPGAIALYAHLETPDGHESASVAATAIVLNGGTEHEQTEYQPPYLTTGVRFEDDTRLGFTTAPFGATPMPPGYRLEPLPSITDPVRLLQIARAYRARFMPGARTVPARAGVPVLEVLREKHRAMNEAEARAGNYRRLPDGAWGLTVRGALVKPWQVAFPLKQVLRARMLLRERHILGAVQAPRPSGRPAGFWMDRTLDVQGVAAVAIALTLLLPAPRLPEVSLPLPVNGMASLSAVRESRPYALPAGFAVSADFAGAVRALEGLAGAASRPLEFEDAYSGEVRTTAGVEVPFPAAQTDSMLAAAAPLFRARGFLLFRNEHTFGIGGVPESVALYPRDAAAEVMGLMGTSGPNYGIGADSVVAWLGRLGARHPFVITGIGYDHFEGRFTGRLDARTSRALAAEFQAFCPDVVSQGTGTVAALAAEIRRTGTLYCWWD